MRHAKIATPAHVGLSSYQQAISATYRWMDMVPSEQPADCHWQIEHNDLGLAHFSLIECEGSFETAIRADARAADERRIVILSVTEGVFEHQAGNKHVSCEPGTMTLMNVGRRMAGAQDGRVMLHSAVFPTHVLATHCPNIEELCCLKVSAQTGLAKVLSTLIRSATCETGMSAGEAQALSLAVSELIDGVFRSGRDLSAQPCLRHYQELIAGAIQEYLADFELCPQMIAEKLGISRSYLFSIARKCDFSIERSILNQRLARCAEALSDGRWAGRNVSEIAYHWGFKDLSHFSRSFSARFGTSPRAYRKAKL